MRRLLAHADQVSVPLELELPCLVEVAVRARSADGVAALIDVHVEGMTAPLLEGACVRAVEDGAYDDLASNLYALELEAVARSETAAADNRPERECWLLIADEDDSVASVLEERLRARASAQVLRCSVVPEAAGANELHRLLERESAGATRVHAVYLLGRDRTDRGAEPEPSTRACADVLSLARTLESPCRAMLRAGSRSWFLHSTMWGSGTLSSSRTRACCGGSVGIDCRRTPRTGLPGSSTSGPNRVRCYRRAVSRAGRYGRRTRARPTRSRALRASTAAPSGRGHARRSVAFHERRRVCD